MEQTSKGLSGNQLKLFAMLAMTVDHFTSVIWPDYPRDWWILLLHIIGRMAAPIFWFMVECAAYGLTTGLMLRLVRTGKTYADLYLSLVAAMLVGRLVSGVTKALFFMAGQYTMQAWIAASFVTALPGIVLQLAVVPSIVYYLMRAGLIPQRYPR